MAEGIIARNIKINQFGKGILAIGALLALAISFIFLSNGNISTFAMENELHIESSRAVIDENFEDNVVVVVLDPKISKINKIHNAKFFGGIEIDDRPIDNSSVPLVSVVKI